MLIFHISQYFPLWQNLEYFPGRYVPVITAGNPATGISRPTLHHVIDVTKSAKCRFIRLPTYRYQHKVIQTCYRHHHVNTAPYQHATNVTIPAKRRIIMPSMSQCLYNVVSTCHWQHNVSTTTWYHASDVTMSAQRRYNVSSISQCQQNVVLTSYRRLNVSTTSYQHATDFPTTARHINAPKNVITAFYYVLPMPCWGLNDIKELSVT